MSKIGPTYEVPFKRRYKNITDYRKRLKLLKSKEPRLVVRKSSRYITTEIVEFNPKGDKVIVYVSSKELSKYGWKFSAINIPAAYLVGLLIGKRAIKKGLKSAVLDIGLHRNVKGSRINAVLKGALDAGLNIPHSPDVLPDESRIQGKHIIEAAKNIKNKNQFSKVNPKDMIETFEKVKKNIEKGV